MVRHRYYRRYKSRQKDAPAGEMFDMVLEMARMLPWWLDVILAAGIYFSLDLFAPDLRELGADSVQSGTFVFALLALLLKYTLPVVLLLGAAFSFGRSFSDRSRGKKLLRSTEFRGATDAISGMSWQQFEKFIGEWFKTRGYSVEQNGGAHADGGVDIVLRKDGELYIVQCKHYRAWKVPVETVRDLLGVMASRGAAGGFVVTSGVFTKPAQEFARGRSITLLDGRDLAKMLPMKL